VSQRTLRRLAGEGKTGNEPGNAFRRIENLRAETRQTMHLSAVRSSCTRAPIRRLSIRAPRQTVLRTSSWLAPSRFTANPCGPHGGEDARCVQPTNATQSNDVHPHLVCSRLALVACATGTPHGVFGSVRLTGGPSVSRRSRTLRRIGHRRRFSWRASRPIHERGRIVPTAAMRSSL